MEKITKSLQLSGNGRVVLTIGKKSVSIAICMTDTAKVIGENLLRQWNAEHGDGLT